MGHCGCQEGGIVCSIVRATCHGMCTRVALLIGEHDDDVNDSIDFLNVHIQDKMFVVCQFTLNINFIQLNHILIIHDFSIPYMLQIIEPKEKIICRKLILS